jgi:alkylation response protein AidB-like acyl-CoA dehydrogenase
MNFEFSEDQLALKDHVRKLLSKESDSEAVREVLEGTALYGEALWQNLCEMGLPGTAVPEEFGGAGAGYLELCVAAEELGRSLATVPFSSSVYLAAEVMKLAGSTAQKEKYLAGIASGEMIATVALEGSVELNDGKISGSLTNVIDGGVADYAIVVASDSLAIVTLTEESVSRDNMKTIDPTQNLANLTFDGTPADVLESTELTAVILERVKNHAAILLAFEQLGGAQKALEMGVEYAKERYAFGRSIGSFQAIKHMLADMYVELELARSNCYYAAWALSTNADELPEASATARVSATTAYQLCSKNNIQTHGGMGFTWESDCHLHYRRSNWLALVLGSPSVWKDKLAGLLTSSVA